jgi:hypothetical protein
MSAAWSKKKNEWDMGEYSVTDQDAEARYWCIKNGIKISPFAKQAGYWYIDITVNGKTSRSPHVYIAGLIWEKIYEYYRYYYDKYKK